MAGGFLCYEEDEKHEKKYKRRLLLTETGKHVAMEIREVIRQAANRVSGGLPEEDLAVFYRVFHRLADNIACRGSHMERRHARCGTGRKVSKKYEQ